MVVPPPPPPPEPEPEPEEETIVEEIIEIFQEPDPEPEPVSNDGIPYRQFYGYKWAYEAVDFNDFINVFYLIISMMLAAS